MTRIEKQMGHYRKMLTDAKRLVKIQASLDKAEQALYEQRPLPMEMEAIAKVVSATFGMPIPTLMGRRRTSAIITARHVALTLSYELTKLSLDSVGWAWGGRDHGTVLNAVRVVHDWMETDPLFASRLAQIRASCKAALAATSTEHRHDTRAA